MVRSRAWSAFESPHQGERDREDEQGKGGQAGAGQQAGFRFRSAIHAGLRGSAFDRLRGGCEREPRAWATAARGSLARDGLRNDAHQKRDPDNGSRAAESVCKKRHTRLFPTARGRGKPALIGACSREARTGAIGAWEFSLGDKPEPPRFHKWQFQCELSRFSRVEAHAPCC